MRRYLVLLLLAFVVFGSNFFLNFIPMPNDPSPADAPHKLFMGALFPTGYLAFVKVLEILGGIQKAFNARGKRVSLADLIVLGGCAAVESATKNAGQTGDLNKDMVARELLKGLRL